MKQVFDGVFLVADMLHRRHVAVSLAGTRQQGRAAGSAPGGTAVHAAFTIDAVLANCRFLCYIL